MSQLIEAFEELFSATAKSGGELAKTSAFALDSVDWRATPAWPEPQRHHIVDAHLASACRNSTPPGSIEHAVTEALCAETERLHWRPSKKATVDGPDIEILLHNFAVTIIIGDGAVLPSDKVVSGFSLQAPDTYYPPHAHLAEESYWIIGGNADWRVDANPWFAVAAGDSVYHKPQARHAMQTNSHPLLTIWLWTSDLDSEVMIVRG